MPHVQQSVTIDLPREEIYAFWRDLENLPRFMGHLERVETSASGHSHWVAKAPAGQKLEWDAEIVEDIPGRMIAWRSLPGADVTNRGSVRFDDAPAGRRTIVTVELEYRVPGGGVGAGLARLFGGEPARRLRGELARFKDLLESGSITA